MTITTVCTGMDACDGHERDCSGGGMALAHHLFDVGHYTDRFERSATNCGAKILSQKCYSPPTADDQRPKTSTIVSMLSFAQKLLPPTVGSHSRKPV